MPDHFPVLTVCQPWNWAALAPIPAPKRAENRGRRIGYRGPLWWHAGARSRWDAEGASSHIIERAWEQYLRTVPDWPGLPAADVTLNRNTTLMPFGAVTALVEVTGCHLHDADEGCGHDGNWERDPVYGRCSPWAVRGQWHIVFANVRVLPEPVPCRGALGLWRLTDEVEQAARGQLEAVR